MPIYRAPCSPSPLILSWESSVVQAGGRTFSPQMKQDIDTAVRWRFMRFSIHLGQRRLFDRWVIKAGKLLQAVHCVHAWIWTVQSGFKHKITTHRESMNIRCKHRTNHVHCCRLSRRHVIYYAVSARMLCTVKTHVMNLHTLSASCILCICYVLSMFQG